MKASIITIGDEILIGQVVDTNSAWLGKELSALGVLVDRIYSIPDTENAIIETITSCEGKIDLLILTGGLGPTKDDLTKHALSKYMSSDLTFNEELHNSIKIYFQKRGLKMTDAIKNQCFIPKAAKVLENIMGTAPGMLFNKNKMHILSLPGVPYEMKWIFQNSFAPILEKLNDNNHKFDQATIRTVGIGETRIEEIIRDIIDDFPQDLSIAYLPSLGQVRLRITHKSPLNNSGILESYRQRIIDRLGDLIYGYDETTLEESLQRLFIEKNLSLATAESCTGGYIAHKITSVPNSSKYFKGSIIAYDNSIKTNILSVSQKTLDVHGAVSEQTVVEMLKGLLDLMKTDLGVAVSGIAGPGGGTPEKPVGTIWVAWGTKDNIKTEKLTLAKNRSKNIEYTTVVALNRLRLFLTP